jgi:hypothetical protein
MFGHVSVNSIAHWEICLTAIGFQKVDFERGALIYEMPRLHRSELLTGLLFCLEAGLDALPKSWVRSLSDEMIGLYRAN